MFGEYDSRLLPDSGAEIGRACLSCMEICAKQNKSIEESEVKRRVLIRRSKFPDACYKVRTETGVVVRHSFDGGQPSHLKVDDEYRYRNQSGGSLPRHMAALQVVCIIIRT